jgi:hypothetical protein
VTVIAQARRRDRPGRPAGARALLSRRGTLIALAAGVTAAVAGGVALAVDRSEPASVGADQVLQLSSPSPASPGPSLPSVPIQQGLPSTAPTIAPAKLRVPAMNLTAGVNPVGTDPATGDFAVPPSVDEVGWYRFGPGLEAAEGSVVIAGHVDSAKQGRGAFFRLRELKPGDPISLTGSDGRAYEFRVVAREEYQKAKIPLDRYFARDGAMRLTLITCGGPFDEATRHYRDNIVVTAVPA